MRYFRVTCFKYMVRPPFEVNSVCAPIYQLGSHRVTFIMRATFMTQLFHSIPSSSYLSKSFLQSVDFEEWRFSCTQKLTSLQMGREFPTLISHRSLRAMRGYLKSSVSKESELIMVERLCSRGVNMAVKLSSSMQTEMNSWRKP